MNSKSEADVPRSPVSFDEEDANLHISRQNNLSSSPATHQFLSGLLHSHGLQSIHVIHDNARGIRSDSMSPQASVPSTQEKNDSRWASCTSSFSAHNATNKNDFKKNGAARATNRNSTRVMLGKQWGKFWNEGGFVSEGTSSEQTTSQATSQVMDSSQSSATVTRFLECSDLSWGLSSSSSRLDTAILSSAAIPLPRKVSSRRCKTGPLEVPMRRAFIDHEDELIRRAAEEASFMEEGEDDSDAKEMDEQCDHVQACHNPKSTLPLYRSPISTPVRSLINDGTTLEFEEYDDVSFVTKMPHELSMANVTRNFWPSSRPNLITRTKSIPLLGIKAKSIASQIDRILWDVVDSTPRPEKVERSLQATSQHDVPKEKQPSEWKVARNQSW
jgi:hypothetical protein